MRREKKKKHCALPVATEQLQDLVALVDHVVRDNRRSGAHLVDVIHAPLQQQLVVKREQVVDRAGQRAGNLVRVRM